jgi:hypothetical protein
MRYCFDWMPSLPPICFYKLFSSQLSSIPRSEIDDADIATLKPMLTPGRHRLPSTDTYDIETTIAGSTLIATIHGPDRSLIRVYVVLEAQGLALAISPPRVRDVHCLLDRHRATDCPPLAFEPPTARWSIHLRLWASSISRSGRF